MYSNGSFGFDPENDEDDRRSVSLLYKEKYEDIYLERKA
jgi:hypothetical protein